MQVIEEITGKKVSYGKCRRVITGYDPAYGFVYGYVDKNSPIKKIYFSGTGYRVVSIPVFGEENIVFSNRRGCYIAKQSFSENDLLVEVTLKGFGQFPYNIARRYEAVESFNLFENEQRILEKKDYLLSDFLKYTFGLEYETSQGYVPEDICFRDGLIPLRDGSIQGIEYSTVVLQGNEGLNLMEQQFNTLREYTCFNKECSLHIHMGGFPLDSKAIYNLYIICKRLESQLSGLLPEYTFNTSAYKKNGKDYCRYLPNVRDFNQLYEYLVGRKFYGDFTQSHPNDLRREAKWRIPTRYFWCNFINLLCYKVNKTIEFRMLRPSYNFEKVTLWIYILNAILQYAENLEGPVSSTLNLYEVINSVYPPEIAEKLMKAITGLQVVKQNQYNNGDMIGEKTAIEDAIFSGHFNIIYK